MKNYKENTLISITTYILFLLCLLLRRIFFFVMPILLFFVCSRTQNKETPIRADAQVNSCYLETQTELDRYLQDRNEHSTKDFDILKWWKAHSSEYPMVARMARDALAMPTCSKLSSNQLAQVRSILRGYSKKPYGDRTLSSSLSSSGGDMVQ